MAEPAENGPGQQVVQPANQPLNQPTSDVLDLTNEHLPHLQAWALPQNLTVSDVYKAHTAQD